MHVMPKRSDNRQVGASSGLGLCNARARASAAAAVPSRPRHTAPPERHGAAQRCRKPTRVSQRHQPATFSLWWLLQRHLRYHHGRCHVGRRHCTRARVPHPLLNDRSSPIRILAPILPINKIYGNKQSVTRLLKIARGHRGRGARPRIART